MVYSRDEPSLCSLVSQVLHWCSTDYSCTLSLNRTHEVEDPTVPPYTAGVLEGTGGTNPATEAWTWDLRGLRTSLSRVLKLCYTTRLLTCYSCGPRRASPARARGANQRRVLLVLRRVPVLLSQPMHTLGSCVCPRLASHSLDQLAARQADHARSGP